MATLSVPRMRLCERASKDTQNTPKTKSTLYILMSLGLHHINLTLKRKKCHFRNEHCLNVKYPITKKSNQKKSPYRKCILKRPHAAKTVLRKLKKQSNTGWVIWQQPPVFIQAMFLALSLVHSRSRPLGSPHGSFQWPFWWL